MVVNRLCDVILSTLPCSIKGRVIRDTTSHSTENMRVILTDQHSPVRPTRGRPDVAYYSCQPPVIPMYLIPISSYYREQNADDHQRKHLKVMNYEPKKIVHSVLVSIINRAVRAVTGPPFMKNLHITSCNVAIQTKTDKTNNHDIMMEEDAVSCSSASGAVKCSWVEDVRALRDSHVRLVLRQLRDIERLNRTLRRTSTTNKHHT